MVMGCSRRVHAVPAQRDDKEPVGKALIAAGAKAVDGVSSSIFHLSIGVVNIF
jgi:hypothetical protein